MKPPCLSAAAALLFLCSSALLAEDTNASNIEVSTGSASSSSKPQKGRVISSDLAKSLSYGIKYNPPPPEPKPEDEVDARDVDKPKNGIIRLPKYLVEGKRPPIFNDRNLYSKEMLRRLAYQRYMSSFSQNFLNRYHFLGKGDEAYALMQYEAEERERNMQEMEDRVAMYRVSGDNAEAGKLKEDSRDTFMRRTDYNTVPSMNGQGNSSQ